MDSTKDILLSASRVMAGVVGETRRQDNTVEERTSVLRLLKSRFDDVEELRDMLGIKEEWLQEESKVDAPVTQRATPRRRQLTGGKSAL